MNQRSESRVRADQLAAGTIVALCAVMSACATSETSETASTPTPSGSSLTSTFARPVSPGPPQAGLKKPVTFDPCFRIGDDLVAEAGFSPITRARSAGESATDSMVVIGCSFYRVTTVDGEETILAGLTVQATNTALSEVETSSEFQDVVDKYEINGRRAVLYTLKALPETCTAAVDTDEGMLRMTYMPVAEDSVGPCDQVRTVAPILAASLDSK
ncbi:hypothetical protein NN3_10490 [Nocardia neocaledoniensis NBRC 108232]|nr:DUF3558 domain-containing protein [Nocardia neocaledoniensis]GEM30042.1 hypothetical protein NN3_10490 [Nocardia neocaledoniensis NBRC 108232]